MMNLIILFFLCSFFISNSAFSDDEFSKVEFKSTPITKSLFFLEGAGGNITASIGPEGVLLVDDDFAEMSEKLVAKLKELGGNSPRYIINTHFHYDHTGGNQNFGKTATIIAATNVRNRLMTEQSLWNSKHKAFSQIALPILTYDQSLSLHMNNEDIRIVHLNNGHTDGDTVVFFDNNNVVSLGDLYFSGMYPIFHPEHQGSIDHYILNLEFILNQLSEKTQVVPGHGPLSTKAQLANYCEMIKGSVAIIQKGIKNGLTLVQLQKNGLPLKWDSFSHGYLTTDKWIALVYKNLNID